MANNFCSKNYVDTIMLSNKFLFCFALSGSQIKKTCRLNGNYIAHFTEIMVTYIA